MDHPAAAAAAAAGGGGGQQEEFSLMEGVRVRSSSSMRSPNLQVLLQIVQKQKQQQQKVGQENQLAHLAYMRFRCSFSSEF
jgi:hypothetical protein